MAKTLDFNKVKKNYLPIVLSDEKQTKINVMTPRKELLEELLEKLPELSDITADNADINLLYEMCAQLMSRNKEGITITAEQLEEILDVEDLVVFFTAFGDFVVEITNQKN